MGELDVLRCAQPEFFQVDGQGEVGGSLVAPGGELFDRRAVVAVQLDRQCPLFGLDARGFGGVAGSGCLSVQLFHLVVDRLDLDRALLYRAVLLDRQLRHLVGLHAQHRGLGLARHSHCRDRGAVARGRFGGGLQHPDLAAAQLGQADSGNALQFGGLGQLL